MELTELEQELTDERNEYRKFFNETPVAFLRTALDSGAFLLANPFCAKLLGFKDVEDLITNGKSTDFYYDIAVRDKLIKKINKQGHVEDFVMKLVLKSGKTIWVSAYLHINCGGTCIEGSLLDITFTKELEFELDNLKTKQLSKMCSISKRLEEVISEYGK